MSTLQLFSLIERAKNLGNYQLANAAFAVLIDRALDVSSRKLRFEWEPHENSYDRESIYYDLFRISDGLRTACIPAPLLSKPMTLKSMSVEVDPIEHRRSHKLLKGILEAAQEMQRKDRNPDLHRAVERVSRPAVDDELKGIKNRILEIEPNLSAIAAKYLASPSKGTGECAICPFFARDRNQGAIHCTVHPSGHPNQQGCCPDFEIAPDYDAGYATQRRAWRKMVSSVERQIVSLQQQISYEVYTLQLIKERLPEVQAALLNFEAWQFEFYPVAPPIVPDTDSSSRTYYGNYFIGDNDPIVGKATFTPTGQFIPLQMQYHYIKGEGFKTKVVPPPREVLGDSIGIKYDMVFYSDRLLSPEEVAVKYNQYWQDRIANHKAEICRMQAKIASVSAETAEFYEQELKLVEQWLQICPDTISMNPCHLDNAEVPPLPTHLDYKKFPSKNSKK